jgi:hypothetical protein
MKLFYTLILSTLAISVVACGSNSNTQSGQSSAALGDNSADGGRPDDDDGGDRNCGEDDDHRADASKHCNDAGSDDCDKERDSGACVRQLYKCCAPGQKWDYDPSVCGCVTDPDNGDPCK